MLSWSKTINKLQIKIKVLSLINSLRRVSFSSPFYLKAGMALEGCLVLPVFLFFMGTLLYSLRNSLSGLQQPKNMQNVLNIQIHSFTALDAY